MAFLEVDLSAIYDDRLPLDGRVQMYEKRLEDFPGRHSEQKGPAGGSEILAVAAPKTDNGAGAGYELDGPTTGPRISALDDGFFVLLSKEVFFIMAAAESHYLGVVEKVHSIIVLRKRENE